VGKELNILFTCVGRRVSLVREFRRAMELLGVAGKLYGTDVAVSAPALQVVDEGIIVHRVRSVQYIPTLLDIVREKKIGLVVPLTDLDLRCLSRQQGKFVALGCTVMISPEKAVKICRNKQMFNKHLVSATLPSIRTFGLAEFRKEPFYPCFVKPLHGSGGVGSAVIKSGRELRSHIYAFGDQLMVQDFVPGQEYTVDVYRRRDGQIECVVPRQRLAVRSGEVDVGITVLDEELIASTKKLAESIDGLWGVFCCQCRRPAGQRPYFFEINPRFGGGSPLSIAAGAFLPLYLLQEVLGLPINPDKNQFKPNMLMMRYAGEFYQQIEDPSILPGFKNPIFK